MHRVLVHGWMVTARVWDAFAPRLGGPTFAPTLIPDPRAIDATTLDDLAADVLDAVTREGIDRFDLVGHSMGGQIAQLVAARAGARVTSLALVNPVPLGGLPLPPEVASAFRSSGGDRAAQGAILDQACRELAPAAKAALLDDAATVPPAWIAKSLDLFVKGRDTSVLADIACPTLIVATSDPFLPPAFLEAAVKSKIRGARLTVIEGPGHYPQVERPDALASILRAFVEERAK